MQERTKVSATRMASKISDGMALRAELALLKEKLGQAEALVKGFLAIIILFIAARYFGI